MIFSGGVPLGVAKIVVRSLIDAPIACNLDHCSTISVLARVGALVEPFRSRDYGFPWNKHSFEKFIMTDPQLSGHDAAGIQFGLHFVEKRPVATVIISKVALLFLRTRLHQTLRLRPAFGAPNGKKIHSVS